jgi:hypothetical protein
MKPGSVYLMANHRRGQTILMLPAICHSAHGNIATVLLMAIRKIRAASCSFGLSISRICKMRELASIE